MSNHEKKYLSQRVIHAAVMIGVYIAFTIMLLVLLYLKGRVFGWVLLLWVAGAVGITAGCLHWIVKPYQEYIHRMRQFASGENTQKLLGEKLYIYPQEEQVFQRLNEMIKLEELINNSKKLSEYIALQNQINPHFLYNTLECIRGETLHAGLSSVAEMTEALATFFRYTISNVGDLVALEDELRNVENYFIIQQYRFENRLKLEIKYNEEDEEMIMSSKLPKLTLQPIVENAVCHGLEDIVDQGIVTIQIEQTDQRLIITVSDNGIGMNEVQRRTINDRLSALEIDFKKQEPGKKGGIAIVNVNNRIRLIYGSSYGIYIYSEEGKGTDVVISLPGSSVNAKIPNLMGGYYEG